MAGFGTGNPTAPAVIRFEIKYKSIEKEFVSSLADLDKPAIRLIRNKAANIINNDIASVTNTYNQIKSSSQIIKEQNQKKLDDRPINRIGRLITQVETNNMYNDSLFNIRTNPDGTTNEASITKDSLLSNLKNTSKSLVASYKGDVSKLISRDIDGNIRGAVVDTLKDSVYDLVDDVQGDINKVIGDKLNKLREYIIGSNNSNYGQKMSPENVYVFDASEYRATPKKFLEGLTSDYVNLFNNTIDDLTSDTSSAANKAGDDIVGGLFNALGL
jgi:hypothetical protein